jgi:hypothetical protein
MMVDALESEKGGDNMNDNHNDDNNDDLTSIHEEQFRGQVATITTTPAAKPDSTTTTSTTTTNNPSAAHSTPSSWALKRNPTHRHRMRRIHVVDGDEKPNSTSSNPLPSSRMANISSNLSASRSLPRTAEKTGRQGHMGSSNSYYANNISNNNNKQQQQQQQRVTHGDTKASSIPADMEEIMSKKTSFKGWLADSMLDVLNTAAGFTISTTGTILSPPIAMTKNVLLPGLLAILVDTLDNITPPRIQDWFRILSSSVYHLYSVLKSTEQGQKFRHQLVLVLQNIFEVWSAPESRQVVVDGMAASVKLADALQ